MSDVKMCDNCGRIFSVNSDDWSTFSGSRRIRDKETGRISTVNVEQDRCARCTKSVYEPTTPEIVGEIPADKVNEKEEA